MEAYDIEETVSYLIEKGFTRVALQFPDELLKDSTAIVAALKNELQRQHHESHGIHFYILADTTYGSCCSDEIAALHVDAQCIIHYGHTCLSKTSRLPVWYVFGRALIDSEDCARQLNAYLLRSQQNLLVLYSLEYAYAIPMIKRQTKGELAACGCRYRITFAEVPQREMLPNMFVNDTLHQDKGKRAGFHHEKSVQDAELKNICTETVNCKDFQSEKDSCSGEQLVEKIAKRTSKIFIEDGVSNSIGGLRWSLSEDSATMEDVVIVWIGQESPALTNVMLTFNTTVIVRYDPAVKILRTDVPNQSKALKRRYYLVERAKDANIVGIVVGTLGVAGFRQVIWQIRKLVTAAGKKPYTLVIGKPNPTKLANFPECDVFVLVACAQTALLDNKEYMAPVITPFEALLAFTRGSQWTGAYSLDLGTVMEASPEPCPVSDNNCEARFSFFKGGYVEESISQESELVESSSALVLPMTAENALELHATSKMTLSAKREAISGSDFFSRRSFQGLEIQNQTDTPVLHPISGKKGRASVYENEI